MEAVDTGDAGREDKKMKPVAIKREGMSPESGRPSSRRSTSTGSPTPPAPQSQNAVNGEHDVTLRHSDVRRTRQSVMTSGPISGDESHQDVTSHDVNNEHAQKSESSPQAAAASNGAPSSASPPSKTNG